MLLKVLLDRVIAPSRVLTTYLHNTLYLFTSLLCKLLSDDVLFYSHNVSDRCCETFTQTGLAEIS